MNSKRQLIRNPLFLAIGAAMASGMVQATPIVVDSDQDAVVGTTPSLCTLRAAVASANEANAYDGCISGTSGVDEIVFDGALAESTITLSQGHIEITNSLTITGLGADQLTVDAASASRHFDVDFSNGQDAQTLVISGISLVNGEVGGGEDGGAIRMVTPVGAVGAGYSADLTLEDVLLENNTADGNGGAVALVTRDCGGLTIRDSLLSGNQSGNFGGAVYFATWLSCAMEVEQTTISGNTNTSGHGGGIFLITSNGGADDPNTPTLVLRESSLTGNQSNGIGGGFAMYVESSAVLEVEDSTVSGNTAGTRGGGGILYSYSAANWHDELSVQISESAFNDNHASHSGGFSFSAPNGQAAYSGSIDVEDSEFVGNRVDGDFGGAYILLSEGNITMARSLFEDNRTYEVCPSLGSCFNYGTDAGLAIVGPISGTARVEDSVITGNIAEGEHGGLRILAARDAQIISSEVSDNEANTNPGVTLVVNDPDASALIENSTISGNTGDGSRGGVDFLDLYVPSQGGDLRIHHSTIVHNEAGDYSGVRFATTGSCQVQNSIIANNDTTGGLYTDLSGGCTATYSLIGDSGGSDYIDGGGNIVDQDPELDPLALNGTTGLTRTHALRFGSPAVIAGDPSFTPPPNYDQRGAPFARLYGSAPDMGAYESPPRAVFVLADLDFGEVSVNTTSVPVAATVENPGGPAVDGIVPGPVGGPDAGHFAIDSENCSGQTLNAGETCDIYLTFTPDSRRAFEADLALDFDGHGEAAVPLTLHGLGSGPSIAVTPSPLDFGVVMVGATTGPQALTVENIGEEVMEITGIGGLGAPFALETTGTCGTFPATVNSGTSCTLDFSFSPTQAGQFLDGIVVQSNAFDGDAGFVAMGTAVGDDIFQDRFED
jgi:hypothetical protein